MVITGLWYAAGCTAAGLLLSYWARPAWGVPLYVLAAFCLYFFRDPERPIPAGPVAVAPADGKVVSVVPLPGGSTRISIFLSLFDVHVNRSPIRGTVVAQEYRPGKFHIASREAASRENEQNVLTIEGDGSQVQLKQIAGILARRIICYKKAGDPVAKGERIGLIQFGSRVDLILGPEWEVLVRPGQKVQAGSDIVARKRAPGTQA